MQLHTFLVNICQEGRGMGEKNGTEAWNQELSPWCPFMPNTCNLAEWWQEGDVLGGNIPYEARHCVSWLLEA